MSQFGINLGMSIGSQYGSQPQSQSQPFSQSQPMSQGDVFQGDGRGVIHMDDVRSQLDDGLSQNSALDGGHSQSQIDYHSQGFTPY